jgi:hypothetical protein
LGTVVSTLVFATGDSRLTVEGYSDVVRFEAAGVATLQVTIYDLSGKKVWDSGMVAGSTVDWDRNNESGERMAYGAYLYVAQGWEAGGELSFKKNGKLALMPGDKVQLQQAPAVRDTTDTSLQAPTTQEESCYAPMSYSHTGDFTISGKLGVGTENPTSKLYVLGNAYISETTSISGKLTLYDLDLWRSYGGTSWAAVTLSPNTGNKDGVFRFAPSGTASAAVFEVYNNSDQATNHRGIVKVTASDMRIGGDGASIKITFIQSNIPKMTLDTNGNVGIGTTSPSAKLEIEGTSGDLIAAYNSGDRVFVVKSTGEVRADGAVYAAGFNTGSADVAERINVSEWVEPGNVVEIDPEHPGFFRKSKAAYSTKVAGIISTSPGVILGNDFDAPEEKWDDTRPVLAVTGRVPCMVSTENGPISIGDLLVASSTPGVAMKGNSEQAMGAVVGKAMEPLEEGTGEIMAQVTLR